MGLNLRVMILQKFELTSRSMSKSRAKTAARCNVAGSFYPEGAGGVATHFSSPV